MGAIGNALIRKVNCKAVVLLNFDAFQQMKQSANTVMSSPFPKSDASTRSNAVPLARVATNAKPYSTADEPLRHASC